MFLRSRKPYLTCITALCASVSFTGLLLFAGIAAACSGTGGGCETSPSVTTTAASGVTSSSAYLNGQINPNGCKTTYSFEIKKSTSETWEKRPTQNLFEEGNFTEAVSEWEPFLQPETTYQYRLNATNSAGSKQGSTVSFTTSKEAPPPSKPSVTNEPATEITSNGATLNGSVNPNGSSTTYKFEYGTSEGSLTKSTASTSVGTTSKTVRAEVSLEPETVYYFRISATNSGGTSTGSPPVKFATAPALWKLQSTPNPGASDSYLYDVSCEPNTSNCTSVGKSTSSGIDGPVALRWNGTSWAEQAPAKKSGTLPTRLLGVDCPSEIRCLAAGNYQPAEGGPGLVTEIWNEGKWNVQTTPVPPEATSSELVAIGCNSTATCTAVGSAIIGGVKKAIAERWTSPTWALSSIPVPEGAKSSQLDGVDCLWSNFCVAVGRYTTSSNSVKSLVLFWNGTEWSQQTVTDPVGAIESALLDVSCSPTPNRCTAVGLWKISATEQFTLAYRFNGSTTWTLQSTPNPSGSHRSVFQDVSCATETACSAVGNWVGVGSTKTLAAEWNGSSWSLQSPPNPPSAAFSSLFGVSCRSSSCMSVGWSSTSLQVDTTLSEFRE